MGRPSDDPRWEEVNPAWKYIPDGDYEILGNVEIHRLKPAYEAPTWSVRAVLRERGGVRPVHLAEDYPDPNLAADAKSQIEAHAWRVFWEYDQVLPGRLPQ